MCNLDNRYWYINWDSEAKHIRLTQEEYNDKFQWYKENGHLIDNRKGVGNRTKFDAWCRYPFSYAYEQDHTQINLYTTDDECHFTVYYTFCDGTKCYRGEGVTGGGGFDLVNRMFIERHDKSLQVGFGRFDNDYRLDTVNMALSPIIYTNDRACGYILSNIYKADVARAYAYGLCFDLPDCHKRSVKELPGVYPPTPEYPFAFYIKSGHMAIYGELDTYKDFRLHPLYQTRGKFKNELYGDRDFTILMKASRFNLDDIMMDLYDQSADDPSIKTKTVAFIGYIRSTKSWQHHYMGHISACAYARHIKRMLAFYDKIVAAGNVVQMISTDSICWSGKPMPEITVPKSKKHIGAFVSEHEGARLLMLANGVYAIEEDGKVVCFKHQGTAAEEITVKIEKLTDIHKMASSGFRAFDRTSKKFVEIDPILGVMKDI